MTIYSVKVRASAVDLLDGGLGWRMVADALGIPCETVRQWWLTYRAVGRDVLLGMGKEHRGYDFETKVAAVRAVVDDGMTKLAVMERFGIASSASLERWCRLYREGGFEALLPKTRGRLRGSGAGAVPVTREQELEERVRKLEAQVAYLKNR